MCVYVSECMCKCVNVCVYVRVHVFQTQEKVLFGGRNQGCARLWKWALGREGTRVSLEAQLLLSFSLDLGGVPRQLALGDPPAAERPLRKEAQRAPFLISTPHLRPHLAALGGGSSRAPARPSPGRSPSRPRRPPRLTPAHHQVLLMRPHCPCDHVNLLLRVNV